MGCAVCGDPVRQGRPPIEAPPSLAGKDACDWCGQRLGQLQRGQLAESGFAQLLAYASKLDNSQLLDELHAMWNSGGALKTEAQIEAEEEALRLVAELARMPVTSGHEFQGRMITGYQGFASSEVVLGMGLFRGIGADFADFFGTEAQGLSKKLQEAKVVAFDRLRREAKNLGGNAIIGIDLDYTMFGASIVGVIASGTAVVLDDQN